MHKLKSQLLNHRIYSIEFSLAFRWAIHAHSCTFFAAVFLKKIFVVIVHPFLVQLQKRKRKNCKYWRVLLYSSSSFIPFFAFLVFIKTSNYFSLFSLSLSSVKEFWICLHFFVNHRSFLLLLLKNRTAAPLFFPSLQHSSFDRRSSLEHTTLWRTHFFSKPTRGNKFYSLFIIFLLTFLSALPKLRKGKRSRESARFIGR